MISARTLALIAIATIATLGGASCGSSKSQQPAREILWDTWGVPHLYGRTLDDAFYLLGWAQARAHANSLAIAFGKSRGRAAEYWGEDYVDNDLFVRRLGLQERSPQWLERISPEYRGHLQQFAQGVNDYVSKHQNAVTPDNRPVFPITSTDLMQHGQRLLAEFMYFDHDGEVLHDYKSRLDAKAARLQPHRAAATFGSNAYAIGPKKSQSGHAMLVINPHLPWSNDYLFFESHIVAAGIDAYGATLLGQPMLAIAFTPHLGWAHTVNPADAVDSYELTLKDNGYVYDGKVVPFKRGPDQSIKVRAADGKFTERVVEMRESIHGPVVLYAPESSRALAVRYAGLEWMMNPERYWSLLQARSMEEFKATTTRLPLPYFNTVYADREGNILYQYNAALPERRGARADWYDLVPGDSSEWLWTNTLPITQMPALANPTTGFLQNSNDPPWSSTFPPELHANEFPPTLAPPAMDFRTQSITKMLLGAPKLDFDELVRQKNSNRVEMAERFLPDLLAASEQSKSALVQDARKLLAAWNYHLDPQARGAIIFLRWVEAMGGTDGDWFAQPWDTNDPLATPRGLKSAQTAVEKLAEVAQKTIDTYGSLDVAFGDVYRMRLGTKDVPSRVASVYYGTAADGGFHRAEDGKYLIDSGDTFVAVVEYSKPIRAEGLLPHGNSTQPGSPHIGDQLELFSQGKLRPLWRERAEIEQHLELRETFD